MSKRQTRKVYKKAEKAFIKQRDQSDCGVACLAGVIGYLGGEARIEELRTISGTTQRGTSLLGLFQAAQKYGLQAEAYEADLKNLKTLADPCILHIVKNKQMQHYVICYGFDGKQFVISDPAEGVKKVAPEALEEMWQSRALLMLNGTDSLVTAEEKKHERWQWIKNLTREDIQILVPALALGIFVSVLSLATAVFSQKLIDEILPAEDFVKLFAGLGLLAFLLFARNGLSYIRQVFLIRQSRDFNKRIIDAFYGSLLRLPVPFFFSRKTGDLIARMNDTRRLQRTITYLFSDVMIDVLMVVTASIFIMVYSFWLGGLVLLSVPAYFLLVWRYNKPILEGQKKVMEAHSINESNYVDTIQGITAIKTGNRESFFTASTRKVYGLFQDRIFELGKLSSRFSLWANMIGVTFTLAVLGLASLLVIQGTILLGALVAIFQMTSQLIPSAHRLAVTNIRLQEAKVAFERMYEFTSLETEAQEEEGNAPKEIVLSDLEIQNLSYRFPGRSPLLKDVSFRIARGEMISLLGESGCGKTTLLHILQRFYEPEAGSITINRELDWGKFSVRDWRGRIASVPQNIKIFNGTLLDNIGLGQTESEAIRIVQFCKEFGFDRYFESFPNSYLTLLGEEGANISGGQRQLVALARALYQQPELLLLDEPTAAMDRETEGAILQLLREVKKRMGIILVTHRVQSARESDRMYILENGVITSRGTPDELEQADNLYARSLLDLAV